MARSYRRYLFLTLTAVATVWVVRSSAQDAGRFRTFLQASTLPAIDRGVVADISHAPGSFEALMRQSVRLSSLALDRTSRSGAHYVAGRVIVKFRDGMSTASRVRALSSVSPTSSAPERPSYANFDIVRIDPSEDAEAVAAALRQRPDVEYAQPCYRIHPYFVPNDPLYNANPNNNWPGQWNLKLIDLERAWDIQPAAGSNIIVAVLDTGLAYRSATVRFHAFPFRDDRGVLYPSLGDLTLNFVAAPDMVAPNRFVAPHDFIWDDDSPLDLDGHGTHVSGTIGEVTNNNLGLAGVAFNVRLMPVKVVDSDWDDIFNSPNQGTDDIVARGIRYAVDNGAKVLNLSIGRTGEPSPVLEDAYKYAVGKGAFLAVAAGNAFEEGNPKEVLADIASRVQGAVAVASIDPARGHAHYSSTGTYVELSAPGGTDRGFGRGGFVWQQTYDFTVTDTFLLPPSLYGPPRFDVLAYVGYVGTSQATPHVSGVAAMLMQQGITDPAAIEAALEKFAIDLGDPGRDNTYGFGMITARDTLRGLGLAK